VLVCLGNVADMGPGCESCPSPAYINWKQEFGYGYQKSDNPLPTRPPAIQLPSDAAERVHLLDLNQIKDEPRHDSVTSTEGDLATHPASKCKTAAGQSMRDVMHPRLKARAREWGRQYVLFDIAASYPMFIVTLTKTRDSPMGPQQVMDAGCDVNRIKAFGFTARQYRELGMGVQAMRSAGWSVQDLNSAGYDVGSLLAGECSVSELKEAGIAALKIKDAGCNVQQLKSGGFSAGELKAAGFDIMSLSAASYSASDLKSAEFSASSLKAVGYSAQELKLAGFTAKELKATGFGLSDLDEAHFDVMALESAGFSKTDILQVGALRRSCI
jgi:ribosomal protein L13E